MREMKQRYSQIADFHFVSSFSGQVRRVGFTVLFCLHSALGLLLSYQLSLSSVPDKGAPSLRVHQVTYCLVDLYWDNKYSDSVGDKFDSISED